MNLTKSEITAFLALLLSKNPVIDVALAYDSISITHFDGKSVCLPLANVVDVYNFNTEAAPTEEYSLLKDYVEYSNIEQVKVDEYIEEAKSKLAEYLSNDNDKVDIVNENIKTISDDVRILASYFDTLELKFNAEISRFDELKELISIQIDESLKNLSELKQNPVENKIIENYTIREDYDDSNLIKWAKQLFDELREEISQIPKIKTVVQNFDDNALRQEIARVENLIHTLPISYSNIVQFDDSNLKSELNTLQEKLNSINEITTPVNYEYIENIIDHKIQNFIELTKTNPIKSIIAIENKNNRLIIRHTDDTYQDITDVLIPILQLNFRNLIGSRGIPSPGGGYGAGSPGLSAYEIALKNGFSGTEVQWLDSLKATSTTIPEDGTILYDGENIQSIIVGSNVTTFLRDHLGTILAIEKDNYTKTFIRLGDQIIGWEITQN